jgi:hypothetical protein
VSLLLFSPHRFFDLKCRLFWVFLNSGPFSLLALRQGDQDILCGPTIVVLTLTYALLPMPMIQYFIVCPVGTLATVSTKGMHHDILKNRNFRKLQLKARLGYFGTK